MFARDMKPAVRLIQGVNPDSFTIGPAIEVGFDWRAKSAGVRPPTSTD